MSEAHALCALIMLAHDSQNKHKIAGVVGIVADHVGPDVLTQEHTGGQQHCPQLDTFRKTLEERGLVERQGSTYTLTELGKVRCTQEVASAATLYKSVRHFAKQFGYTIPPPADHSP